ncbi:unnamed protein product, partial [Meganyctiphanes norvegica]
EDILYGKPYGVDDAKEGYFSKKHVTQSQYGLADADLCSDLWSGLDFTIHKMEVKTVGDFKRKLLDCREVINSDTRPQDCLSFTFIGHGYTEEKTEFIELDGYNDKDDSNNIENGEQPIVDDIGSMSSVSMNFVRVGFPVRLIYEMFTPQLCPKLLGIPKLFYIQACRGDKIDTPLHIIDDNYQMCSHETAGRAFIANPLSDNQINLKAETVASYSDLYVFCSSFSGYFSYFSRRKGKSFFIEEICNIYKKDHKKQSLSEMNIKVKDKISKINIRVGVSDEKQIPTISVDTMTKILKFK